MEQKDGIERKIKKVAYIDKEERCNDKIKTKNKPNTIKLFWNYCISSDFDMLYKLYKKKESWERKSKNVANIGANRKDILAPHFLTQFIQSLKIYTS
jgi:hypothetical protein